MGAVGMTDLGAFLQSNLERRREPEAWDCCGMPAAWSMACGTADPMADWRGRYRTDAEAEDILAGAGGLIGLFGSGLESVGWRPTLDEPEAGDLAVITLLDEEAGALYTGRRWAFVATRGLGFVSLERDCIARTWRLGAIG